MTCFLQTYFNERNQFPIDSRPGQSSMFLPISMMKEVFDEVVGYLVSLITLILSHYRLSADHQTPDSPPKI